MKKIFFYLSAVAILMQACSYQNEKEEYGGDTNTNPTNPALTPDVLVAISFENNFTDSSIYSNPVLISNKAVFSTDTRRASSLYSLNLDGNTYLQITTENADTMSLSMWFKGSDLLSSTASPVLFDYGKGAASVGIDGTTGATYMAIQDNLPSNQWINSAMTWNHLYAEFTRSGKIIRCIVYAWSNTRQSFSFEGSDAPVEVTDAHVIIIGGPNSNEKDRQFKGLIDDLRIYKRALSDSEINALLH